MTDAASFRRDAEALHRLGPRAIAELLAEVAAALDPMEREWLFGRLGMYRALAPGTVRAVGGDAFPATFLCVVK